MPIFDPLYFLVMLPGLAFMPWAQWRVRRHLRPGVFSRLPPRILRRYSEALELPVERLRILPDAPLE